MKFGYLIEPPFNYRDATGTVLGCDVELAQHVSDDLDTGEFEPVETEFAELLPGVASGRWRMTTGLFATPERCEVAAFSRPIWALPDGLLVPKGNPLRLTGYRSIAQHDRCVVAVIRDQFQHRSAADFGTPSDRILVFETCKQAALAVRDGRADAYASVDRAHKGFLEQNPDFDCDVVMVPASEKQPAFGCFAFGIDDVAFRQSVDVILNRFIGSKAHRRLLVRYGFDDAEIDSQLMALMPGDGAL